MKYRFSSQHIISADISYKDYCTEIKCMKTNAEIYFIFAIFMCNIFFGLADRLLSAIQGYITCVKTIAPCIQIPYHGSHLHVYLNVNGKQPLLCMSIKQTVIIAYITIIHVDNFTIIWTC